ncbi:MAG TPA: AAA family ATPase [Thermomicrobiales bacterium]|nr:AAA family ATPase [Thermomicrobiales bacterium]
MASKRRLPFIALVEKSGPQPEERYVPPGKMGRGEEALMDPRQVQSVRERVFALDIEEGTIKVGVDEESSYKEPVAHIVVGFIGSRKTTFARKLEKETGAVRFTKDEWMVRLFGNTPPKDKFEEYDSRMASLATDMALRCLKAGIDVVIDEGFWVKEQRDEIRQRVKSVGATPKLYYLRVPLEVMKARALRRTEQPPIDSFTIDEESFNHYWRFFQPPDKDEECTLIGEVIDHSGRGRSADKSE